MTTSDRDRVTRLDSRFAELELVLAGIEREWDTAGMGGDISVRSAQGEGATITIVLPAEVRGRVGAPTDGAGTSHDA